MVKYANNGGVTIKLWTVDVNIPSLQLIWLENKTPYSSNTYSELQFIKLFKNKQRDLPLIGYLGDRMKEYEDNELNTDTLKNKINKLNSKGNIKKNKKNKIEEYKNQIYQLNNQISTITDDIYKWKEILTSILKEIDNMGIQLNSQINIDLSDY